MFLMYWIVTSMVFGLIGYLLHMRKYAEDRRGSTIIETTAMHVFIWFYYFIWALVSLFLLFCILILFI